MSATLKNILAAAREQHWKYGRHGVGGRGREVAESESDAGSDGSQDAGTDTGDNQVENDPIWRHRGGNGREG